MNGYRYAVCTFIAIFLLTCGRSQIQLDPQAPGTLTSMTIKVSFSNSEQSGSGRINLNFDSDKARILFLTPLNQLSQQLFLEDEKVILLNSRKKIFWTGRFGTFLFEMWGIDIGYAEFRDLIVDGTIPAESLARNGLEASLRKNRRKGTIERVSIDGDGIKIRLKILSHRYRSGQLQLINLTGWREVSLGEVLDR